MLLLVLYANMHFYFHYLNKLFHAIHTEIISLFCFSPVKHIDHLTPFFHLCRWSNNSHNIMFIKPTAQLIQHCKDH